MPAEPALTIVPLTAARFADLAALFEEGGDPKWCWCAYFRIRSVDFSSLSKARNRSVLERAVEGAAGAGRAPGLLAYADDRAVGWISLGPREDFDRLAHSKVLAPVDDLPVWSIVCFVVSRSARGQGIARQLLDAAISYARERGAVALEAYPVDTSEGRVPNANAFRGTLSMFERAGFREVARRQWNRTTPVRPIVRLALTHEGLGDGQRV